jgi:flagellar basal body rod protein FlgB
MTVLGKILVFVNLVFSLMTAGLIIMVYTTRINWFQAYTAQKAAVGVVRADATAAETAQAEELKRRDADFQQLLALKGKLEGEGKTLADQLAKAKADYEGLSKTHTSGQKVNSDQTAELERRKAEVETLKKQTSDQDKKIADIDRQMARLRDESVQYRIQWEQTKDKLRLVQDQVVTLTQENGRLRQQLGGGAPSAAPAAPAGGTGPAARIEDLQGTVQRVEGDLVTITPGSDAGVTVGAKLRVFHLQPKPEFLGEITILAVKPTEAVGRLTGPKARQVKKGDEVDAR